jgi:hypothetical protein
MRTGKRNVWLIIGVAAALLFVATGGSMYWNSTAAPTLAPVSMHYDPAALTIGDQLTGLKLIKLETESYGKGSIVSVWGGELQVSGTYEYMYKEATYNSREIIFIPDAASAVKLPQPKAFEGQSMRFVLHFAKDEDKQKFGPPGSRGNAALKITSYASVYAGILEGTSDTAAVQSVLSVQVTLPPLTQITNADLKAALRPFPVLQQIKMASDTDTLRKVQDWLYEIDMTLSNGLGHSEKRISADQREQIRIWLTQAFTDQKSFQLLENFVPASEGGYLINGGLSGLNAASQVKELKDQKLVAEKDGTAAYKVTYVLSGTQDAYLTCKLVPVDSQWKIGAYTIGYY